MVYRIAAWVHRNGVATGRSLVLCGWSLVAVPLAVAVALAVSSVVWVLLVPALVMATRKLTNHVRLRVGEWAQVPIPVPYQPRPDLDGRGRTWQRWRWLLTDPATWRDLWWLLVAPTVGASLAALPASVISYGLFGLVQPVVWHPIVAAGGDNWYGMVPVTGPVTAWVAAVLGVGVVLLGLAVAPWSVRAYARVTTALLGPSSRAALTQRVQHLTETRADAVDAQAAELRRIERDLHDGAQVRLVAMGMTLAATETLVADNAPARELVAEARQASVAALDELRDLVRGIHPPVLADRGLGDAVRALALDSRLPVTVTVDVPGRLPPAVESAAYFAVSEVLANAAKHAGARQVTVSLRHDDGWLRMTVSDDGRGGARVDAGTGLRGVQRRLAAFDGTFTLTSPPGGPTIATMELPCALSSPKTKPSSGTA